MKISFITPFQLYAEENYHNQLKTIQLQWEGRGETTEKWITYIVITPGKVTGILFLLKWLNEIADFDESAIGKLMNLRDKAGNNVFSEGFLNYLQRFRYAGMLWTMPEETLVFENQPILQIKGNAIQVAILQLWVQHLIRPAGKMEESTQQIQVRRFYNSDLQQIQDIIFSPDSEPIVNFEATSWQDLLQLKTYKVSETL